MSREVNTFLTWGAVAGARGLRGELKVRYLSPDGPDLQLSGLAVWFRRPGEEALICHRVKETEPQRQGLILRLEKVETSEDARPLFGCEALVRREDLPPLSGGRPYWFQLEGLQVWDLRHGAIGRLDDLFTTPAHPIYVVNGSYGEVLIPAVGQFIIEIDLEHRRMTVDLPAGLIPEADEI